MKLYYNPLSTYSQKVVLAFHEKQVEFEPEIVHLFDPESNARHREMYPMGKIPVLKPSEDHMIPESSIIVEYLDGHFDSGTRLIPEDRDQARQVRFMDRMADLYLNNPFAAMFFEGMKPEQQRDDELIERNARVMDISYDYLNRELAQHEWLHESGFSMADCAAMPVLFYARQTRPYDDYPHICAYWERAEQRASWQKNLEQLLPALEAFEQAQT